MRNRILVIQNDSRVPAGIYGRHLQEREIPHRMFRPFAGEAFPAPDEAAAVLVLGGYMGVHDESRYPFLEPLQVFLRKAAEAGTPLLGICLGGQLLAAALEGDVSANARGEKGLREIVLTAAGVADPLFAGVPARFHAFEWHNDSFDLPPGALPLAASASCPGQAFRFRNAWGIQFHPEVDAGIVAAWSAKSDPEGRYLREFAGAEEAHREMAVRLLENFLAFAGLSSLPRPDGPRSSGSGSSPQTG